MFRPSCAYSASTPSTGTGAGVGVGASGRGVGVGGTGVEVGIGVGMGVAVGAGVGARLGAERLWQQLNSEDGEAVRGIMRRIGFKTRTLVVNDALIALVAGAGRRLDLLVNNASLLGPSPQPALADYPLAILEDVLRVNARSQAVDSLTSARKATVTTSAPEATSRGMMSSSRWCMER